MPAPAQRLRLLAAVVTALFAALALSACGTSSAAESSDKPLRILVSPTPHAEILKEVERSGLLGETKLEISEISGDIDPNQLLEAGDIDANYFQHAPYLKSWSSDHKVDDLVNVAGVHVEPLGLYSEKVTDLLQTPSGSTVALPNNPTNFARGLFLLEKAGLISLDVKATDADIDFAQIGEKNVVSNPHNLKFLQIDAPQLANTLKDAKVNLSVINGNYALEAGLNPAKDALDLESATGNPYANTLTVKSGLKDDPRVQALAKALESGEIATWIDDKYNGSVIAVHAKG